MSEECTDYYDCRVELERLLRPGSIVHVELSRHAVERLLERRPRDYRKLDVKVLEDVVRNVVRDGLYKAYSDKVVVWTKRYVLICTVDRGPRLVVKTVIGRHALGDRLRELLSRGGRRAEGIVVQVSCRSPRMGPLGCRPKAPRGAP